MSGFFLNPEIHKHVFWCIAWPYLRTGSYMDIFVALFYGFYIKEVFRTKEHMTYMRAHKFTNADMMVYTVNNYIYFHQNSLGILFMLFVFCT